MAIFGNATAGTEQLGLPDEDEFGHFHKAEIVSSWDADVPACVVTKMWVYARGNLSYDPATLRMAVYDASDADPPSWTVEAESPPFAILADNVAKWYSVNCNLVLTAGKKALAVIAYGGHDYSANIYRTDKNYGGYAATFISTAGQFEDPLGTIQHASNQNWSMYAEYTEPPAAVTPGNLYAPVDAIPIVTDGRNTTGFASGHDAKYVLDNDPDTWWTPDDWGSNSIYVDLGAAKTVDALTLWLHNYNEAYDTGGKTWQVAYSDDDSSYVPLTAVAFDNDYGAVELQAFEPTSARYWRVTFGDFNVIPVGPRPEISAVWILKDCSLPWSHQSPESNRSLFHNNVSVTRSGHRFASDAGVGRQRILERRFVLTDNAGQWTNLLSAYNAARGRNLPIIMQTEFESTVFYAVTFDSSLSENRYTDRFRKPLITLRELGFKRVPYDRRTITSTADTIALWRFRGDFVDNSGNGHGWNSVANGPESYARGILEHGDSVIDLSEPSNRYLVLNSADLADFSMGTNDFSIEIWMATTNSNQSLLRWAVNDFNVSTGGYILGLQGGKIYSRVGDGTVNDGSTGNGPTVNDGDWHLLALSVDRVNDRIRTYVDGVKVNDRDISAITGDIELPGTNMYSSTLTGAMKLIDEIHVIKGHALTDTQIATRYAETVADCGEWGM